MASNQSQSRSRSRSQSSPSTSPLNPPPQHSSFQYRSLRPSTTTTSSSPRDPTIRHAGRAHIRGKIRRVWRPRYLELCDTGLVRYYELPPTADVTLGSAEDWDHVNMIPKDHALVIYHARIIDVTTLRDLHVGLPKGSYGFLFRGQRHLHSSLDLLMNHANEPNPPREYFCAVSTLEEAQTWVIVLQWAASVCKAQTSQYPRSLSSSSLRDQQQPVSGGERDESSSINFLGDSCHIPSSSSSRIPTVVDRTSMMAAAASSKYNSATTTTSAAAAATANTTSTTSNEEIFVDTATTSTSDGGSVGAATTSTTDTIGSPTVMVTSRPKRTVGRIVVTKVDGCQVVRVPASSPAASLLLLEWQIAYDIGVLLIQHETVEERRILRTAHDLHRLLDDLSRELDSKISLGLIHEWQSRLQARPLPPTSLNDYSTSHIMPTSDILNRFASSFYFCDQLLRALAMDANIVNSSAMKRCLVLDTDHPTLNASIACWWKVMPASPHEMERSLTYCKSLIVAEDDTDSFVKSWLHKNNNKNKNNNSSKQQQHSQQDWKTTSWLWVLQRPWMVLGGAGVGLALSVPLARVYQQTFMGSSVQLRLDVLMGSWCLAAYLGKEYWKINNNNHTTGSTTTSSSHKKLVTASRSRLAASSQPGTRYGTARTASRPQHAAATASTSDNKHLTTSNNNNNSKLESSVVVTASSTNNDPDMDSSSVDSKHDLDYMEHDEDDETSVLVSKLSSPLPQHPLNNGESCWSSPTENSIFRVRGKNYLEDRIKIPSGPSPFKCRGVDVWLTDNPERHIARHPSVLNGKLHEEDTFMVNFLLPFGNFVSYFTVPPLSEFPDKLATVWSKFVRGDQQYRDKRLKLLPVVMDGPWIVKAAVGNGTAPALLGKVIPLQYFFQEPKDGKAVYEVDVIITASSIAKGILSVVKGHTKSLTIAFAFIIEAAEQEELPETVLCAFQVHQLHLEDCPHLPECNLDEI
jgi:hypothetical protein